jgi:hypothetical protein
MPGWLKWLVVVLLVLLIAANIYLFVSLQKTRRSVASIHDFLGSNRGNDPTRWSGYLGIDKQNNKDLRDWLGNLRCRIKVLEEKSPPGDCPPDGPPGTVPKDDGTYPP